PATGEPAWEVTEAGPEDAHRAVDVAARAFDEGAWSRMSARERGRVLTKASYLIRERQEDLARLEARNVGKPIGSARAEVDIVANVFEYWGGAANKIFGETIPIVPRPGSTTGSALIADPRVSKISFTGSTEVGTRVMQAAAENITRVSLELGGKSASVVFADADLDVCVESSLWSVFDNAGQDCCTRSRQLIQRPVYDEFISRFAERTDAIRVGPPLEEATEMGPLVSDGQRQTSLDYIEIGVKEGAK